MRQSFFLVSGLILLAIGIGIPELCLWGLSFTSCTGDCTMGFGLTLLYSNGIVLPCISIGTILVLLGMRRENTAPSHIFWFSVLSLCFSALSIALRIALLYHLPLPEVITVFRYIFPFLPLSSAMAAVYLTYDVSWRRGRLLSNMAAIGGIIALFLGVFVSSLS